MSMSPAWTSSSGRLILRSRRTGVENIRAARANTRRIAARLGNENSLVLSDLREKCAEELSSTAASGADRLRLVRNGQRHRRETAADRAEAFSRRAARE